MIIDRNMSKFVVFLEDSVSDALRKIGDNRSRIVFVIESNGLLRGVVTDGDLRRWLMESKGFDPAQSVSDVMNTDFISLSETESVEEISSHFSDRIECIPLVDVQSRLVGLAWRGRRALKIGEFTIGDDAPAFVIAEIGNNHNGSLKMAKELIDQAVKAGADCAKFQMRNLAAMYRGAGGVDPSEDLGAEYTLDLLSRFQLSESEMFKAFDYCVEKGILPLCTPWDKPSLDALEAYGMVAYKLASADITNLDLIDAIAKTQKPLICSTGMSTEGDIAQALEVLKNRGAQFVLLHCNSTYPAPFKDIDLKYLTRLQKLGGGCPVGYSGHERGYSVPIAAVAMGARVIEKHFTLDRSMEGNDHRVSLLPDEFAEMVRGIREVEEALGSGGPRSLSQGEIMNREVLGKSVLAATDIRLGQVIERQDLEVRSPGRGLQPNRLMELVGTTAKRDVSAGDFFYPSDVGEAVCRPRPFQFDRPFGIPVRYHDADAMISRSNFDMVEFHLSYRDLEVDPSHFLTSDGYDLDFAVHSPELFANDHILDLCSDDPVYRARSINELRRVIDTTLRLKRYFRRSTKPVIIVNAGGFSLDGFIEEKDRIRKYQMVASSIHELDTSGVEITIQTMPPFPWHFGGQRYHNLFTDHREISDFCALHNIRITLDISHSKLYCNYKKIDFGEFVDKVAPYAAHIHVVDAYGTDGEGVQIGEGEIDFRYFGRLISEHCPSASFIPEIWQGHKNGGEGFWFALDKLEAAFAGKS